MPHDSVNFSVIIPARYASQRLPGKPMIQHVYERAVESGAAEIIVATDDVRIVAAVESFGGEVCLTAVTHSSGSERLAEVVSKRNYAPSRIVVNLQGDEPLMPSSLIRQVARDLQEHSAADLSTLRTRIHSSAQLFDPHTVKVVSDANGYALYFSRAPIPWDRDAFTGTTEQLLDNCSEYWRHIGLYAYRAGYLAQYATFTPSPSEKLERLEQLRVLWHGGRIHVAEAGSIPAFSVDTQADLEQVARAFI